MATPLHAPGERDHLSSLEEMRRVIAQDPGSVMIKDSFVSLPGKLEISLSPDCRLDLFQLRNM
jgi:hypothetical protein